MTSPDGGPSTNAVVNVYASGPPRGTFLPARRFASTSFSAGGAATLSADPEAETGRYPEDSWCYAVRSLPERQDLRGIHCGGRAAWGMLEGTFPGGRYAGSGAKL